MKRPKRKQPFSTLYIRVHFLMKEEQLIQLRISQELIVIDRLRADRLRAPTFTRVIPTRPENSFYGTRPAY